ncbi:MAG: PAS domain-containing protein [Coriobacteriia bacterium]|nr:PAS domain-containing protein [Coriobacteriia bacterium]
MNETSESALGIKPESLYLTVIDNLLDGVYFVNTERQITFWNKAAEEITGYQADEILGRCCQSNLLEHIDCDGRALCNLGCPLFASILDGRQRQDEVFLRHKDGYRILIHVNVFPIVENGKTIGAVEIFTPRMSTRHDYCRANIVPATPFSNQTGSSSSNGEAESYIAYKLHDLKRSQNNFCVLFFTVDGIESVNEKYGEEVAACLQENVFKSIFYNIRPSDHFSYWQERGFIGVFEVKKEYEATLLADKIRYLVEGSDVPSIIDNFSVTASIGVTMANETDTIHTLVERAYGVMRKSEIASGSRISSDG